jgi:hypothetical protein
LRNVTQFLPFGFIRGVFCHTVHENVVSILQALGGLHV